MRRRISAFGGRLFPNYFILLGTTMLLSIALLPLYVQRRSGRIGVLLPAGLMILGVASALKPLVLQVQQALCSSADRDAVETAASTARKLLAPRRCPRLGFCPSNLRAQRTLQHLQRRNAAVYHGGNFASVSTRDQGLLPDMVASFEEYLSRQPPKLIVVYTLTQVSIGPCAGKGIDATQSGL